MSLFLFYFFNTVNHFIPSIFWNNSLESIDSAEHLFVQENHGRSSTGSFHSLWSLKALQSHFPINLGGNVSKQVVPADICCLYCLVPVPIAPRYLTPTGPVGSHRGSSLPSPSMGHSSSVGPWVSPKFLLDPTWRKGAESEMTAFVDALKLFRILRTRADCEELQKDLVMSDWPRK